MSLARYHAQLKHCNAHQPITALLLHIVSMSLARYHAHCNTH